MSSSVKRYYYSKLQAITHQARTSDNAWLRLANKEDFRKIIIAAVDHGFAEEIEITDVTTIENQGD